MPVILFLSTIPKIAYFFFIYRLLFIIGDYDYYIVNFFYLFFIILLFCSIFFSFLKAIIDFDFYKLFAFSSIGNTSFAFLPFFITEGFNDKFPLFFYLYIYCLTLIGFFILISCSLHFSKNKDLKVTAIFSFFNPAKYFILSIYFLIYLLSFSGLPIFLGFLAKATLSFTFISS